MSDTVLITGANSGLGFDSARQLAGLDRWSRVIVTARTQAKADAAVQKLVEATGRPASAFGTSVFDNNLPATIGAAVAQLKADGEALDAVILNAGGIASPGPDKQPPLTDDGVTRIWGMNVGGHAVLVHGLLEAGLLKEGATVVFAGSEASRGVPAMGLGAPKLPRGFGDLDATLDALVHGRHGGRGYDPMADYALVKLLGVAWIRNLAREHGLRALTVSPGFTGGTEVAKELSPLQRFLFLRVMFPVLKLFGNAHDLEVGAARYVQALQDDSLEAGGFYASPGRGISGDLAAQSAKHQPLLDDADFQAAVGRLTGRLVGNLQAAA